MIVKREKKEVKLSIFFQPELNMTDLMVDSEGIDLQKKKYREERSISRPSKYYPIK